MFWFLNELCTIIYAITKYEQLNYKFGFGNLMLSSVTNIG